MEAAVAEGVSADRTAESTPTTPLQTTRKCQKRKRRFSGGPWEGRHGRGGRRTPHKKAKLQVSSTHTANNIMRFRLGGSVSDPLNLAGGDDVADNCSTCAPSPVTPTCDDLELPDLPPQLMKDPLNLEGKVKNFPLSVVGSGAKSGGSGRSSGPPGGQRKKPRRRTTSGSKPDSSTPTDNKVHKKKKDERFCYGNYNRYYGYRNEGGAAGADPRLSLLHKEWFQGRDCLDIGCNTGQVTMAVAKEFHPRLILGLDIDHTLITTAWKNLNRLYVTSYTSDGKPFPCSLTMIQGMLNFPPPPPPGSNVEGSSQARSSGTSFPHNILFQHGNYMPASDAAVQSQEAEYDVILALSLTKWIHLNWGDAGIKRFFQKVYAHLRPGGRFIVEPQPFSSYSRRKRITESMYRNYQNITFHPQDFHGYLMSPQVGFSLHHFLGTSVNRSKGFQRPLHVYTKAMPSSPSDSSSQPHPLDHPRLKSVVVVCSNVPSHSSKCEQQCPPPVSSHHDLPRSPQVSYHNQPHPPTVSSYQDKPNLPSSSSSFFDTSKLSSTTYTSSVPSETAVESRADCHDDDEHTNT